MGTTAYSSGRSKRLFTNYPFKKGMNFTNLISGEYQCKSLINYDYTNAGDYVYPRPAFVNALFHNGLNSVKLPESTLIMKTNLGPKFLVSADSWVSKEDFLNDTVTARGDITGIYGLHIHELEQEISSFETVRGTKVIYPSSVVDGNHIYARFSTDVEEDPTKIQLLGIKTPTVSEDHYADAVAVLQHYLDNGTTFHIVYDPASAETNEAGDVVAYLFVDTILVNAVMAHQGLAEISGIEDNYMFYDTLIGAYYFAVDRGCNLWGEADPVTINASAYAMSLAVSEEEPDFTLNSGDNNKELYFKQAVINKNSEITETLYDTISYFGSDATATTLFIPNFDTYIQMLRNDYEKDEYSHLVKYFEYPHVNHSWRNAMSFLGRVVKDGVVVYKGLITIQYVPDDGFKIILIKPRSVNPLMWNSQDAESIYLNALDPNPQVYQHEIFTADAAYFRYPTISTTFIYDRDPIFDSEAKLISSFDKTNRAYIQPYLVIPQIPVDSFVKTQIRFKYDPNQEAEVGWEDILIPVAEATSISPAKKIIDPGGDLAYLKDTIRAMNKSVVFLSQTTQAAWNATTETYVWDTHPLIQADAIAYYPIGAIFKYTPPGFPSVYYEVKNSLSAKDFSNLNSRPLEVELRTIYLNKNPEAIITSNPLGLTISATGEFIATDPLVQESYSISFQQGTTTVKDGIDTLVRAFVDVTVGKTEGSFTKRFLGTHYNAVTDIYEFETTDEFSVYFDKINFIMNYKSTMNSSAVVTTLYIDNEKKTYTSTGVSQIIYLSGFKLFQDDTIMQEHDIYKATSIAQFDRYLILYGDGVGNHSLQFLEYDDFALAPFPYGQITFDSKIIHVHPHRGTLYVFCEDGVWILHKGFGYSDMIKTFAYAGISLNPAEKGSVASLGNNVFVIHNHKGYVIRTNVNVEDQSDVYTIPITSGVEQIMEDPRTFLKDRLQYGYAIHIDNIQNVTAHYKSYVTTNEIFVMASYHIGYPLQRLLVTYVYNNDTGRWKLYDSVAAIIPIDVVSSGSAKGFDLFCVNDFEDGMPTLASYLFQIPYNSVYTSALGDSIGLVRVENDEWKPASKDVGINNPFIPIACEFDTGSLDINSMHKKKFRRFYVNIINVDGESLEFKGIPYIDGVPAADNLSVEALLNVAGELEESITLNAEIIVPNIFRFIQPSLETLEGYTIPESSFTTYSRVILDLRTNLLGKIPGLKLLIPTKSRYHITHYAIVYRQQMAR